jgi:nucleoid-associated protein YgaU
LAFFVTVSLSTLRAATAKDELGYPTNSAAARDAGMAEARRDLNNGVLIVKTAGLPSPDRADYQQLLKERCNARLQPIAGCIVTGGLLAYMGGYNEVSTAAIKQRFGTNIFEQLNREAKARFEKQLADASSRSLNATKNYIVRAGDTLSKIALDQGVRLKDLLHANPGVEPTKLQVNQKLVIPTTAQP